MENTSLFHGFQQFFNLKCAVYEEITALVNDDHYRIPLSFDFAFACDDDSRSDWSLSEGRCQR
jgi:hypothetical protein